MMNYVSGILKQKTRIMHKKIRIFAKKGILNLWKMSEGLYPAVIKIDF